MRTLKEAREYERTQKPKPLDTYLKHLGQMNYQIMTVNEHGTKHFYGETFRKNTISQSAIKKCSTVKIITVLKINLMHFCNRVLR